MDLQVTWPGHGAAVTPGRLRVYSPHFIPSPGHLNPRLTPGYSGHGLGSLASWARQDPCRSLVKVPDPLLGEGPATSVQCKCNDTKEGLTGSSQSSPLSAVSFKAVLRMGAVSQSLWAPPSVPGWVLPLELHGSKTGSQEPPTQGGQAQLGVPAWGAEGPGALLQAWASPRMGHGRFWWPGAPEPLVPLPAEHSQCSGTLCWMTAWLRQVTALGGN